MLKCGFNVLETCLSGEGKDIEMAGVTMGLKGVPITVFT